MYVCTYIPCCPLTLHCLSPNPLSTLPEGVPFPKNFLTIAKTILKRLFRVYAHIYHAHFRDIISLGEEAHLNTSFKHFIYFIQVGCVHLHTYKCVCACVCVCVHTLGVLCVTGILRDCAFPFFCHCHRSLDSLRRGS